MNLMVKNKLGNQDYKPITNRITTWRLNRKSKNQTTKNCQIKTIFNKKGCFNNYETAFYILID